MALPKKKGKIRGHAIHLVNGINNLDKCMKEKRSDLFFYLTMTLINVKFHFFYYTDRDL
jgi:hypothetical protein